MTNEQQAPKKTKTPLVSIPFAVAADTRSGMDTKGACD